MFGSIGDKIGDDLITAIRASVDMVLGKRIVIETTIRKAPMAPPIEVRNVITFEEKK